MNQIEKVARAAAWLRECHDWLLSNDLDMGCPMVENPLDLAEELEAIAAMQPAPQWQGIETAPKDRNILVWFDHEADPYQDPQEPHKLTPYAAWAEGGEYLDGKGHCIAKWHPQHFETEDEYGNGYWMPAAWFAYQNGDWEVVCNPTHWMPLPTPPAGGSDAE